MAHLITDNMIAWKGETPWHGLGFEVSPDATGEEMLKVAKLDWQVQRRMLAMRDGAGKGLVTDTLSGFRAIVREDTNQVFQIATDRYHPIQPREVVNFFREYCEAGEASMEVVGALKGGAVIWALARVNGTSSVLNDTDKVESFIMLATSFDGSLRTIGKPTRVRVVCNNTMSIVLTEAFDAKHSGNTNKEGVFMLKHSKKFTPEVAKQAKEVMGIAIEQHHAFAEVERKLARTKVDQADRLQFVRRLLGGESVLEQVVADSTQSETDLLSRIVSAHDEPADVAESRVGQAILDAIIHSPGADLQTAKDTLWGCVNGVSYWTDHERGRNADNRLQSAWFGQSDKLKQEAVKVALDMVGGA